MSSIRNLPPSNKSCYADNQQKNWQCEANNGLLISRHR